MADWTGLADGRDVVVEEGQVEGSGKGESRMRHGKGIIVG